MSTTSARTSCSVRIAQTKMGTPARRRVDSRLGRLSEPAPPSTRVLLTSHSLRSVRCNVGQVGPMSMAATPGRYCRRTFADAPRPRRSSHATCHTVPVVQHRGCGSGQLLCVTDPELADHEGHPLHGG